jgi:ribosomal protein L11 methyltransferase
MVSQIESFSMNSSPQKQLVTWHALDVMLLSEANEAVEYALMEAGALGTETSETGLGTSRVTGYFSELPDRERVRAELFQALNIYSLPSSAVREMNVREVMDQDWLAEWKKGWQPVDVGDRFTVAPPWSEIADNDSRIIIRIEPGMAFGTGTHETTRMCLQAIEKFFAGVSFLDVGTGTGILAIAAAKLIPGARVEASDTDALAIATARENARLNGVADRIEFRVGSINETGASVDCVCANLTTETILEFLPALIGTTCGRLILSGILATEVDKVIDALRARGITNPVETMFDGEWACIVA